MTTFCQSSRIHSRYISESKKIRKNNIQIRYTEYIRDVTLECMFAQMSLCAKHRVTLQDTSAYLIFRSSKYLCFQSVELPREAIIRNYRRGINAKRTPHRKILSRAFKRSFRRNSKSFLKAERRERNTSSDHSMDGTNKSEWETSRSRRDRPRFREFAVKIPL